jgi:hypothetical protein
MTRTQERAVAAMRAIGDAVTEAPPLRLPPLTAERGARRNSAWLRARWTGAAGGTGHPWRLWLAPAAAAVAVIAVAVSLVLVRTVSHEPGTRKPTRPAATGSPTVPPYYVTLGQFGWYAYAPLARTTDAGGLEIGVTATGKTLATVAAPHGLTFNVVTAAADDRTFVAGATSYAPGQQTTGNWSETWYLLRIAPGTGHVAQLSALPVPAVMGVTGVALSPDGTRLAVAYQQLPDAPAAPVSGSPALTLWSLTTGKPLRHWGTLAGQITASKPAGAGQYPFDALDTTALATALRWTSDGRDLAFAWNGAQVRVIDLAKVTSRRSDLVQASIVRVTTDPLEDGGNMLVAPPEDTPLACDLATGWSLSARAKTFTCAGSYHPPDLSKLHIRGVKPVPFPHCTKATPRVPVFVQDTQFPTGGSQTDTLAEFSACAPSASRIPTSSLGWASSDGSTVIGLLGYGFAAGNTYGIFVKGKYSAGRGSVTFTRLPLLPAALVNLAAVAW